MGAPSGDMLKGTTHQPCSGQPGSCFRESFHCAFAATKHEVGLLGDPPHRVPWERCKLRPPRRQLGGVTPRPQQAP